MIHPAGYIPAAPMGHGLWAFSLGVHLKVSVFIDGFNLYHAIDDLGKHHLKWLDLRKLSEQFAPKSDFIITSIYYFSAYAYWRKDAQVRHREYVKALKATGVTPIMGKFKEKDRSCRKCGHSWKDHEEKETDVNIATYILREAYKDSYDILFLISADSDLAPAIRLVKKDFPEKKTRVIFPPSRGYSWDLVDAVGGKKNARRIKPIHIERSLLGMEVQDESGRVVAKRPDKYTIR